MPSYRWATCCGSRCTQPLAGYEDVNDCELLSQIRPSRRDAVMEETKRFVVAKAQLDVAIGPNGESFSDANDENGIRDLLKRLEFGVELGDPGYNRRSGSARCWGAGECGNCGRGG